MVQKGGSGRLLVAVGPLLSLLGSLTRWRANSDIRGNPCPQEPQELGLPTALQEWRPLWCLWGHPVYNGHSRAGLLLPFSSRFS